MDKNISKKNNLPALLDLYDYHTKSYHSALVDISEEDAQKRLSPKANHLSWIAGALVQQTYMLAKAVGITKKQTSDELFTGWKGIQDNVTYPPLAEYKKDWDAIRTDLRKALLDISEEQLNGPDPFEMPGGNYTFFDMFAFSVDRESYCIGQIGLLRKLLGYDAIKFE